METVSKTQYDRVVAELTEMKVNYRRQQNLMKKFIKDGELLSQMYRKKDEEIKDLRKKTELLIAEGNGLLENYELLKNALNYDNRKN